MMQPNENPESSKQLGVVISGSLTHGIEVKLDGSASVEDMAVGRYVTIEGRKRRFFGMMTDVTLEVVDEQININPSDATDPFLKEVLEGTSTYGIIHVLPMLTIGSDTSGVLEGAQPVKTVPTHFSPVKLASQEDIEMIFGSEDEKKFFIGTPLDMETKICLDLVEFVKRSNGIFGKSGTGKTFFTRQLLIGMLQKSQAVNLIFDMQNEYGWKGLDERGPEVKGLKQLFPSVVAVFALDEEHVKQRGISADFVVKIGYDEIEPDDIVSLRQTLGLTDPAVEAVYQLHRKFGSTWLKDVLEIQNAEEIKVLLERLNIHEGTFQNLRRGLGVIKRLPFIVAHSQQNAVDTILNYLEKGMNIVLEFGRYRDITTYVFVANMLTRRIYTRYQEKSERALDQKAKPRPLVITIEEAHKFLNPEVADQTIFGTIAREMRKYNVTLLIVDQRPSGIYEEVMSQLGTKIVFLLDNEKDVDSVLSGASGKNELKSVLAKLEPKQQALIFGHSLPMPVVIRTPEYGSSDSYKKLGAAKSPEEISKKVEKDIEELWG
jgi:DNA helicase HerA-like ATPase